MAGGAVWSCRFPCAQSPQCRLDVVLCDAVRQSLSDDVTVLSCQAVVSINRLANLKAGVVHVQLIGESRVCVDRCSVSGFIIHDCA